MSLVVNLRKIAIKNCLSNGIEVYIDRAYRHYSRTYGTPLHIAYDIKTEPEVLLIYMEDQMEDFSEEDLKEQLAKLSDPKPKLMIEPPKYTNPRYEMIGDDEAWIAQMNAKLRKEEAQKLKDKEKAAAQLEAQANDAIAKLTQSVNKILKE